MSEMNDSDRGSGLNGYRRTTSPSGPPTGRSQGPARGLPEDLPVLSAVNVPREDDEQQALDTVRRAVAAALARAAQHETGSATATPALVRTLVDRALDEHAREAVRAGQAPLDAGAEGRIRQVLVDSFSRLGGLQPLLDDPRIETININGPQHVFVRYSDGTRAQVSPVAESDEELIGMLRALGAGAAHERRFDLGAPKLSIQLPGGERLFATMDISDRVAVSIRRHRLSRVTVQDLVDVDELSPGLAQLLVAAVRARRNIVISGGPAAGKTTLLRALATAIPAPERIITIEDTYELALPHDDHPDMVAMQTRDANIEGSGGIDMGDLLRASLRMTPDRVIVGEVRGPEVVQMARAMSIGIDGSMATVHASSSRQALDSLVGYAMEPTTQASRPVPGYTREGATALIARAVHLVVHLDMSPDGRRAVSSVREVVDTDGSGQISTNEIYQPGPSGRATSATSPRCLDALIAVGFDPGWFAQDRW